MLLALALFVLAVISMFIGVIDITPAALLSGDMEQLEIFLISRLPRLLAILCTGVGMSVAGLIMQQLCMNKFVSPTTGATISSAQLGILLALLFMPASTLWGRAIFAFIAAILRHRLQPRRPGPPQPLPPGQGQIPRQSPGSWT